MRSQRFFIIVSVIFGLLAAYTVTSYTKNIKVNVAKNAKPIDVLVASKNLSAGLTYEYLVSKNLVKIKRMPKEYAAQNALNPLAQLGDKVLAVDINEGEQLTKDKFKISRKAGLSFVTPENMVAIAIPTDEMRAVGNLLKVGDYVNIIGTIQLTDGQQITKTILQKVSVLAIGQDLENAAQKQSEGSGSPLGSSDQSTKSITLAVSQLDAEKIVFVQERGKIWLSLSRSGDQNREETAGQTMTSLLSR